MNIAKKILVVSVLSLLFFSCRKNGDISSTGTIGINISTDDNAMLKLVNDVRAAGCTCGTTAMPPVPELTWNTILAGTALSHSKDMNVTGMLNHNSSDGTSFSARITAAGYTWKTLGENIASGQTTEQQVFNAWLQSEDHCKNMMNAAFKDFGEARDGNYWTQDFGAQ
jgi:uncharacterized protein YkwD